MPRCVSTDVSPPRIAPFGSIVGIAIPQPQEWIKLRIIDPHGSKYEASLMLTDRVERILHAVQYRDKSAHAYPYYEGKRLQKTRLLSYYKIPDGACIEIRMSLSWAPLLVLTPIST